MDSRYIPMTEADCRQTCATLRQMLTSRTKEITELKEKNAALLTKVSEQEKEIHKLKIELKDTREYWVAQTKNQLNRYEEVHALWTKQKAEVSEQENEIALLKEGIKAKTENAEWWSQKYSDSQKVVSEQSQSIEALTKENETLAHNLELEMKANQEKEKVLTEQVEKLNKEIEERKEVIQMVINDKRKFADDIISLREEKKELVESLREIKTELYSASGHSNTTIILRHLSNSRQLVESLLSKFEVPNQS